MSKYISNLNIKETQLAIQELKFAFTKQLNKSLNLVRVSAPLFVESNLKINDGLNGEKPVSFFLKHSNNIEYEVVHSLSKWKRIILKKYGFQLYEGIYTDMNAIRKEEIIDNIHSYYVDQWDWEMIISKEDRNINFLKNVVNKIFKSIRYVENKLTFDFPNLPKKLPETIKFITAQELQKTYPDLTPSQREYEYAKKYKAIFIIGIGHVLSDGKTHSRRSFDYDDWTLNGDLIFYDTFTDQAIEISSMGIRVDAQALEKQINITNISQTDLREYHNQILNNELPFTIGGGIGQSRLSMFLLNKKHIGEVQVGSWPKEEIIKAEEEGIFLL